MQSAQVRMPPQAEASKLVDRPTGPADTASQHWDQPIDRDHEHGLLNPLDAALANQAHDRHRAVPTPPPTAARQPCRWSRTRATWRSSYVLVFVSTTKATLVGAIANESMSPRPCHDSE